MHDSSTSGPGAAWARALPKDAFRDFLLESRSLEDSLHYRQGELAFGQEEFDLALSHHLSADLPDAGELREDLLAQRSRIFARIWPSAAAPFPDGKADPDGERRPQGPAFEWGAGAEHSREMDRIGPLFPEDGNGSGEEIREWRYRTYARGCRPVPLGKREMILGLSANATRSSPGRVWDYAASLDAEMQEGMLENLFLSFSAGLSPAQAPGSGRYYALLVSKTWYSKAADAGLEAGYSRQWEGGGKRLGDDAWAKASRGFPLRDGNPVQASLEAAVARQASQADGYGASPLYFSFSPSLSYAFPMPAGLQAQAGARYALDAYPGKARRVDNRTGLDFKLWKDLPHGYALSLGSSAELGWTNHSGTAPVAFRPWQWGLAFNVARSSFPWQT